MDEATPLAKILLVVGGCWGWNSKFYFGYGPKKTTYAATDGSTPMHN